MPEEHSRFGYSAVSCFEQCPYKYQLTYLNELKTIPSADPTDALLLGTAMHTGIEKDIQTAVNEYIMSYPVITDEIINETIKIEYLLPIVKKMLPEGAHELQIKDKNFIGTMDLIVPAHLTMEEKDDICWECGKECNEECSGRCRYGKYKGFYDLYDFKYSNNWIRYQDSRQLHIYKYYFEKTHPGKRIRSMYFVMIPKVQIRQKKTEDIFQFRMRLVKELDKVKDEVKIYPITYDSTKVIEHLEICQNILTTTTFEKHPTKLCGWCEYKKFCEEKDGIDMLPSIERVQTNMSENKKIWIYGAPFSGKTTVCDDAPTPLNLNTDGNVKGVTMARLPIKNTVIGRQIKPAWEVFKDAIDDLEKGSDFETVVVDLLEDTYESCRLYMYEQLGISHESDDSFRAWDKVRTEFLSTIKRLMNLPYNIVLISHEDTSKDITKKSGDKITAIKPNIQDKIANKIAGMVDVVCRVVVDERDERHLSFKTDGVQFGGGRLKGITTNQIPLSWDAVEEFYKSLDGEKPKRRTAGPEVVDDTAKPESEPETVETAKVDEPPFEPDEPETTETPRRRARRTETAEPEPTETPEVEEQPKRRVRRTRG